MRGDDVTRCARRAGPPQDGDPARGCPHMGSRVLWSASEGAGTARPHPLRISSAKKSVVTVAGLYSMSALLRYLIGCSGAACPATGTVAMIDFDVSASGVVLRYRADQT